MSTRTGFLSDENMKKMCATHMPVPMNRPDLLPARPVNTSGIYMRKLKELPVLQRPAKANYMLNSLEQITGKDVSVSYVEQLEKRIDRQPAKILPRTFGDIDQQTYTNLSSVPNIADEMYRQDFIDLGLAGLSQDFFGELETLPESEVPATIATSIEEESEVVEPMEPETAEMETQTRTPQLEYINKFIQMRKGPREKVISALLREYAAKGLEPPERIPNNLTLGKTLEIYQKFLDDIYEYDLAFINLDQILESPESEIKPPVGEPSGTVSPPPLD